MENNRVTILYTFLVLKKHSSLTKPLNAADIIKHIKKEFNLEKGPDRRTIYASIEELKILSEFEIFGYEILDGSTAGKPYGHFLQSEIETSEIKLLCDLIASSRFINQKQSKDLIRKLSSLCGEDFTSKYSNRLQYKTSKNKTYNSAFFTSIDVLSEAIEKNKKVTFQYLKYNINKKLIPSKPEYDGYKTVQPYYLIWAINHYYLMCRYENSDVNRFLRVDKIRNVKILDQKSNPLPKNFNLHDYARNQTFMFGGEVESIRFRCQMRMLGQVIDFFGEDVDIKPINDDYFEVRINTSIESIRYWILQYITAIDEIWPDKLRNIIINDLEDALQRNRQELI